MAKVAPYKGRRPRASETSVEYGEHYRRQQASYKAYKRAYRNATAKLRRHNHLVFRAYLAVELSNEPDYINHRSRGDHA